MPFPRSQLDIIIVFQSVDYLVALEEINSVQQKWDERGWFQGGSITPKGKQAFDLGHLSGVRFEISKQSRLFANHQGGYRVLCPNNKRIITGQFSSTITSWRKSNASPSECIFTCSECGEVHSLIDCIGHPPFAFGFGAIHLSNVDKINLSTLVIEDLINVDFMKILKRVG